MDETNGDDKLRLTNAIYDERIFDIEDSNNQEMGYNDNKYIDWSEYDDEVEEVEDILPESEKHIVNHITSNNSSNINDKANFR
jgi:hypothetical protein